MSPNDLRPLLAGTILLVMACAAVPLSGVIDGWRRRAEQRRRRERYERELESAALQATVERHQLAYVRAEAEVEDRRRRREAVFRRDPATPSARGPWWS